MPLAQAVVLVGWLALSFAERSPRLDPVLVRLDAECNSRNEDVGPQSSLESCAAAVWSRGGTFFVYGKGSKAGRCYLEETASRECPEGWDEDLYNFYELAAPKGFHPEWYSENVEHFGETVTKTLGAAASYDTFILSRSTSVSHVTIRILHDDRYLRVGLTTDPWDGPEYAGGRFLALFPNNEMWVPGVNKPVIYFVNDTLSLAFRGDRVDAFLRGERLRSWTCQDVAGRPMHAKLWLHEMGSSVEVLELGRSRTDRLTLPHASVPPSAGLATLVRTNVECRSADKFLGMASDLTACAQAVSSAGGRFLIYGKAGKAGKCYMELTVDERCQEGWEVDEFDFYQLEFSHFPELVKTDAECMSPSILLGTDLSLDMCAELVREQGGRFMSFGKYNKMGFCILTHTTDGCPEGWQEDSYDFYRLVKINRSDYVVVGAGSAGSVVASLLSRDGASVVLLEAGESAPHLAHTSVPALGAAKEPAIWRNYEAKCSVHSQCYFIQGKVLGGGAAVNNQIYTRAPAADFPLWSSLDVSEAYAALEADQPRLLVSSTWDELGSLLRTFVRALESEVPNLRWRLDPHEAGASTARISGYWRSQSPYLDQNSGNVVNRVATESQARSAQASFISRRTTPYDRLIANPFRRAHTLQVVDGTHVSRVMVDDGKAIGVRTADGAMFHARRETILSAGALGTPQLLHVSGVTARKDTNYSSFPLRDKYKVWLTIEFSGQSCDKHLGRKQRRGEQVDMVAFLNASSTTSLSGDADAPVEFQLWITETCNTADEIVLIVGIILLDSSSQAEFRVRTNSEAGGGHASSSEYELEFGDEDAARFERMVRILERAFWRTPGLAANESDSLQGLEVRLDPLMGLSGSAFANKLKGRVSNWNHPTGTCPVGDFVDDKLRVIGVDRLRIVDASVLRSVSGHSDSAAQVLGYLSAKDILKWWKLDS